MNVDLNDDIASMEDDFSKQLSEVLLKMTSAEDSVKVVVEECKDSIAFNKSDHVILTESGYHLSYSGCKKAPSAAI